MKDDRLPKVVMGPVFMASEEPWLETFLQRRESMGAPFPEFALFPSFKDGKWQRVSARLQDFNEGLRQVLAKIGVNDFYRYSSHSCKTCLLNLASVQ
eukprot:678378-Karenia_brevis.AAC.1